MPTIGPIEVPEPEPIEAEPPPYSDIEHDIELLGRDATYDDRMGVVIDRMRLTPDSSNVWGYTFEAETPTHGILYVTFQSTNEDWSRGPGPGPTYAYFDVPRAKYNAFNNLAETTAGGAVWDYLRVRGTDWGHQHRYKLVQTQGDYVPRKATQGGLRGRTMVRRVGGREQILMSRNFSPQQMARVRAQAARTGRTPIYDPTPNRGAPNRGRPNRGRP